MADRLSEPGEVTADGKAAACLAEVRGLIAQRDALVTRARRAAVSVQEFNPVQDKLAARTPALAAAVEAALKLHREFRIYEPCEHHHVTAELESGDAILAGGDFITCEEGFLYSVCQECCAGGVSQTEECAADHHHDACWPCTTRHDISAALLGEEGSRRAG